jgi:inorganic pyrophosphatase
MIEHGEVDDKMGAVLESYPYWSHVQDFCDLPRVLQERLTHYFSTYKLVPHEKPLTDIEHTYGLEDEKKVIGAALED